MKKSPPDLEVFVTLDPNGQHCETRKGHYDLWHVGWGGPRFKGLRRWGHQPLYKVNVYRKKVSA